jgi:uncharacterized protein YegL
MLKKLLPILFLALFAVSTVVLQQEAAPRIEITGVNPTELPTVVVTVNVLDAVGQPARDLSAEDFAITGELAGRARIVAVQNVTDDNLPISVVLMIDVSSSMDGVPIERAREAAQAFTDAIGDTDTVAIMTFGSSVELLQPYTDDSIEQNLAISELVAAGQTALYQGAFEAVAVAAESPTPRRAVILLSDGAEFGGVSQVAREAALEQARIRGVPVYTIGLGFGTDRSYLEELSTGTNARFVESPEPDQLLQIYTDLANLLRTQYVVTIEADLPLDGQEYDLGVQVTTDEGAAEATAVLRAPIPIPIITLPALPPLTEPTEIEVDIAADDEIERVVFQVGEGEAQTDTEAPYTVLVDPFTLEPGTYTLSVVASDVNGDVGRASGDLVVAVLPPLLTLNFNTDEPLAEPQTITLDVGGQSAPIRATYTLDDLEPVTLTDAPFSLVIDPYQLLPGEHSLTVEVENATGGVETVMRSFEVASLPPRFEVTGLTSGQVLDDATRLGVTVLQSQTPVTAVSYTVNLNPLDVSDDFGATLDPLLLPPGNATLNVSATNDNGETAEQSIAFVVTALPPQITLLNLRPDEALAADRTVGVELVSQSEVLRVDYFIDDVEVDERGRAPYDFVLEVLDIGAGEHSLRIEAVNASGELGTAEIAFSVAEAPIATATQAALNATGTAIVLTEVEMDARATIARATLDAGATVEAAATGTQLALDLFATQQVGQATGTAAAAITGTVAAQRTASAFSATAARGTLDANSTLSANASATTESDLATRGAVGTATQAAQLDATMTAESVAQAAAATATGDAEQIALAATATALDATREAAAQSAAATATGEAEAEAEQIALAATATALDATREAVAQAAAAAATNAAENAQATERAASLSEQQASDATATAEAAATRTAVAVATQTEAAEATATFRSIVRTATAIAQEMAADETATQAFVQRSIASTATAIQEAAATGDARATEQAQQTQSAATDSAQTTQVAQAAAATQSAAEAGTREAGATATAESALTQTQAADQTATAEQADAAEATEAVTLTENAAQTATADAQATLDAAASQTALAETAAAETEQANTQVAQALTDAAPSPTPTITVTASVTPTLVPIELEGQAADTASQVLPILIILFVLLLLLVIIFAVLRGRRQQREDDRPRRRP